MIKYQSDHIVLGGKYTFSPKNTFECGQCFRFNKIEGTQGTYAGIAGCKYIEVRNEGDDTLLFCSKEDFETFWRDFFDLDRDYDKILLGDDDVFLASAAEFGKGIRILNQEPWEALCSFIISQCNNIPRIKGIIDRFCKLFGEKKPFGHCFPHPEVIAALEESDLAGIRAGYRAAYIINAARAVVFGDIDLENLKRSELSTEELRKELLNLRGVGVKVADCALLYGFARHDAFPMDVWMKRAISSAYPDGYDPAKHGENAGIVQQYIFYYARECASELFTK